MNPSTRPEAAIARTLNILVNAKEGISRSDLTAETRLPAACLDKIVAALLDRGELSTSTIVPESGRGRAKTLYFYKPDASLPALQLTFDDAVVVEGVGFLPTVPLGRPPEQMAASLQVGGRRCIYCKQPLPTGPGRPRQYCSDDCRLAAINGSFLKMQHILGSTSDPCWRLHAARQLVALDLAAYGRPVYLQFGGMGMAVGLPDRILPLSVYAARDDGSYNITPEDPNKLFAVVFVDGRIEYHDDTGNLIDPSA